MTIYRQDYIACPWCGGQSGSRVDHLYDSPMPRKWGPWACSQCRHTFEGAVNAPGDVTVVKVGPPRSSRSMALLKFDGKDGPVFFVMDHGRYRESAAETDEDNQDHQRYFFEEHSCPTNWLGECVAVIADSDSDPHGFLEFVRAVDVPEDFDPDSEPWRDLFPEAFAALPTK